jgi:hypothetical protein
MFWDIMSYSPLKVNWRFEGLRRLHLQGRRTSQAVNQHEAWYLLLWRWRRQVPPKHRLTFDGINCVISQKIKFFTTTAVSTWNPIQNRSINRLWWVLSPWNERLYQIKLMDIWAAAILVLRKGGICEVRCWTCLILYGFPTIMGAFIQYALQMASVSMIYSQVSQRSLETFK